MLSFCRLLAVISVLCASHFGKTAAVCGGAFNLTQSATETLPYGWSSIGEKETVFNLTLVHQTSTQSQVNMTYSFSGAVAHANHTASIKNLTFAPDANMQSFSVMAGSTEGVLTISFNVGNYDPVAPADIATVCQYSVPAPATLEIKKGTISWSQALPLWVRKSTQITAHISPAIPSGYALTIAPSNSLSVLESVATASVSGGENTTNVLVTAKALGPYGQGDLVFSLSDTAKSLYNEPTYTIKVLNGVVKIQSGLPQIMKYDRSEDPNGVQSTQTGIKLSVQPAPPTGGTARYRITWPDGSLGTWSTVPLTTQTAVPDEATGTFTISSGVTAGTLNMEFSMSSQAEFWDSVDSVVDIQENIRFTVLPALSANPTTTGFDTTFQYLPNDAVVFGMSQAPNKVAPSQGDVIDNPNTQCLKSAAARPENCKTTQPLPIGGFGFLFFRNLQPSTPYRAFFLVRGFVPPNLIAVPPVYSTQPTGNSEIASFRIITAASSTTPGSWIRYPDYRGNRASVHPDVAQGQAPTSEDFVINMQFNANGAVYVLVTEFNATDTQSSLPTSAAELKARADIELLWISDKPKSIGLSDSEQEWFNRDAIINYPINKALNSVPLKFSTRYNVSIAGDTGSALTPLVQFSVRTATIFNPPPFADELSTTSARINFALSNDGTIYILVRQAAESGVNTPPDAKTIVVPSSGRMQVDYPANSTVEINGLVASTPYFVYLVGIDTENAATEVATVRLVTRATDPAEIVNFLSTSTQQYPFIEPSFVTLVSASSWKIRMKLSFQCAVYMLVRVASTVDQWPTCQELKNNPQTIYVNAPSQTVFAPEVEQQQPATNFSTFLCADTGSQMSDMKRVGYITDELKWMPKSGALYLTDGYPIIPKPTDLTASAVTFEVRMNSVGTILYILRPYLQFCDAVTKSCANPPDFSPPSADQLSSSQSAVFPSMLSYLPITITGLNASSLYEVWVVGSATGTGRFTSPPFRLRVLTVATKIDAAITFTSAPQIGTAALVGTTGTGATATTLPGTLNDIVFATAFTVFSKVDHVGGVFAYVTLESAPAAVQPDEPSTPQSIVDASDSFAGWATQSMVSAGDYLKVECFELYHNTSYIAHVVASTGAAAMHTTIFQLKVQTPVFQFIEGPSMETLDFVTGSTDMEVGFKQNSRGKVYILVKTPEEVAPTAEQLRNPHAERRVQLVPDPVRSPRMTMRQFVTLTPYPRSKPFYIYVLGSTDSTWPPQPEPDFTGRLAPDFGPGKQGWVETPIVRLRWVMNAIDDTLNATFMQPPFAIQSTITSTSLHLDVRAGLDQGPLPSGGRDISMNPNGGVHILVTTNSTRPRGSEIISHPDTILRSIDATGSLLDPALTGLKHNTDYWIYLVYDSGSPINSYVAEVRARTLPYIGLYLPEKMQQVGDQIARIVLSPPVPPGLQLNMTLTMYGSSLFGSYYNTTKFRFNAGDDGITTTIHSGPLVGELWTQVTLGGNASSSYINTPDHLVLIRDVTPPEFSIAPAIANPGSKRFNFQAALNEDGIVYYIIQQSSVAGPTSWQVYGGRDGANNTVDSGHRGSIAATKDVPVMGFVFGLQVGVTYSVWLTAIDSVGNLREDNRAVQVDYTTSFSATKSAAASLPPNVLLCLIFMASLGMALILL